MRSGEFAEFWRVQGCRVIETQSCFWYSPKPLIFMSLPYHRLVTPSRRELAHVLLGGPAVAARFPSVLNGVGGQGGLFLCEGRTYDFSALHGKARNQTRRGLERCSVEQIDFGYLLTHGQALNVETLMRQGRDGRGMSEYQWRGYCRAADKIPGFEAWCAFVGGSLAAFMVTALVEDWLSILHQSAATQYLGYYPNNALVFTVTKRKLSCPEVGYVSYGLKSLDDTAGLDQFKLRMGFTLKPFKECFVFNPLLKPFLSSVGYHFIKWMARRRPESDLWRKATRVLRVAAGRSSA